MNLFKEEQPDESIENFKPKDYNFDNYTLLVDMKNTIDDLKGLFKTNHYYRIDGFEGFLPNPMIAKYLNYVDETINNVTKRKFNFLYVFKNEEGQYIDKYGNLIDENGFLIDKDGKRTYKDVWNKPVNENGFLIDENGKPKIKIGKDGNPIKHINPPIISYKFSIDHAINNGITVYRHGSAFMYAETAARNYFFNGGKKTKKSKKNKKSKKSKKTRKNKK